MPLALTYRILHCSGDENIKNEQKRKGRKKDGAQAEFSSWAPYQGETS